ncbi:hypothetical protein KGA65_02765 [Ideonella sp. B7]|uniref:PhaM family polyhydroxyalkanoate granule multifunctional regulatory protein n=1 Tax=Ideonella benzenivorans TaxID=2831643 RepID=UPI001CED67FE|nr:PhaM family polyhydroxyalkanoate granule multifunctional regulatory protein [Ideonella benzenivorans]MCA6215457.1 hypothetical protein [Ideonella benzenivorans]
MSERSPFPGLMPGFDFLQGLVRQAGAALPGMNQWIAPTLDPEELDKRISELRTVQFWLEQNARLLATTIQALEVQRMTLATLKTMNVSMGDLRDAMSIPPVPAADEPASAPAAAAAETEPPAAPPAGMVDPMQWWGALTQQFGQIAAQAMQEAPSAAPAAARPAPAPRPAAPRPAPAAARPAAPAAPRKAAPRKKPAAPR